MRVSPPKEKTCFKCRATLPIDEFYRHPQMGDGYLNKCKLCARLDVQANRINRLEYYREYDRARGTRVYGNAGSVDRKASVRHRLRNPAKSRARAITGNAIRDGQLIRQPCEVCGERVTDAHHDDYAKPLDVRWLCRTHHAEHHKAERARKRAERMC